MTNVHSSRAAQVDLVFLSRICTDHLVRTGQFRPGPGTTSGSVGQLGRVVEDRVEIVVNDGSKELVSTVIQELKKASSTTRVYESTPS